MDFIRTQCIGRYRQGQCGIDPARHSSNTPGKRSCRCSRARRGTRHDRCRPPRSNAAAFSPSAQIALDSSIQQALQTACPAQSGCRGYPSQAPVENQSSWPADQVWHNHCHAGFPHTLANAPWRIPLAHRIRRCISTSSTCASGIARLTGRTGFQMSAQIFNAKADPFHFKTRKVRLRARNNALHRIPNNSAIHVEISRGNCAIPSSEAAL